MVIIKVRCENIQFSFQQLSVLLLLLLLLLLCLAIVVVIIIIGVINNRGRTVTHERVCVM